ncbi:MAG TPA: hypothetical protein VLJ88_15885 [Propionibacteriaceae bacterium]|nr:hypothetical protein [Propionibacteriaceae bacterium]
MTESIAPKSDQMNAEDLLSGPRTFTISEVRPGGTEQPVSVYLSEFPQARPFKPAKTVRKLMVLAWGPESDAYIGKRLTLYCDPTVKWAGKEVGGIRVSHMSGLKKRISVPLSITRGTRALYVVEPLSDTAPAARAPGPLDHLVWAMNAAQIDHDPDARLAYCRGIVQRSIRSAADMTPDEVAAVIAALNSDPADLSPQAQAMRVVTYPPEPSDLDLEPTDAERAAVAGAGDDRG